VGVVLSERMASIVIRETGLPLEPIDIQQMISTSVDPQTVLMNVTVTDISADRSQLVASAIADKLDSTIGELENRGSRNTVQLRVISGPTLNPNPVSPRKKLNLGLGLLLGLGVGIAQALLRYQLDNSFRSQEQLTATGVPFLGIQHYDSRAKTAPILPPHAHRTRRAEAIRQLRTNLRFVHAAKPVRVLAITSSVESEGKSTLAANLAQSFAELGRRVLLVDADLRKPRLGRLLDLEGSAGLTSVLIGEAKVCEVVQEWGPDALRVLTSGLLPPNPSELLASPAMNAFLEEARANYDVVILDTSPLLPVTDGAVTATQADGVIMLVRYGKTARDQVSHSLDMLRAGDARILGTVFSMAPLARNERQPSYYEDPVWPTAASPS
jgi:capsular exopolysaccharide synthesis family protein